MARHEYGVGNNDVIDRAHLTRDIKTPLQKTGAFIKDSGVLVLIIASNVIAWFYPLLNYINFFVFLPLAIYRSTQYEMLPMYVPKSSGLKKDPAQVNLKDKHRRMGAPAGIHYFGYDPINRKQVWSTDNVIRQHQFMAATTGGGKTESLVGIIVNFFLFGSGFIIIDGKADIGLPAKIFAVAYRFLRVNDVLLVNYIRGGLTLWEPDDRHMSNQFNQFQNASVSSISELMKSLLSGDGDIWSKRADDYISGLTRPLAYQRDKGSLTFSIRTYVEFMELETVGLKIVGNDEIPDEIKASTVNFVRTLPGMDIPSFENIKKGKSLQQNAQVYEQFGFITMQIIPVLNMLKGDFGHIFNCVLGHINMQDVASSRRCLLTLLPALENSPATLQAMGRVVITAAKDMMSMGTGRELEGDMKVILDRRISNCYSPFGVLFDEAAYYAVEFAFAPIFAQARGLGFAAFIAVQDIGAVKITSDKIFHELKTAAGNAVTKIGGKIEDMDDTLDIFIKRAGKQFTARIDSLDMDYEGEFGSRKIENRVSIQEQDVLTQQDFTSLYEGEVIMLHRNRKIVCDMFDVVSMPTLRGLHLNDFIPIARLSKKELSAIKDEPERLTIRIRKIISGVDVPAQNHVVDDINKLSESLNVGAKQGPVNSWISVISSTKKYRDDLLADFQSFTTPISPAAQPASDSNPVTIKADELPLSVSMFENGDDTDVESPQTIKIVETETSKEIEQARKKFDSIWDDILRQSGLGEEAFVSDTALLEQRLDPGLSSDASYDRARETYELIKGSNDYPSHIIEIERSTDATVELIGNIIDKIDKQVFSDD